MAGENEVYKDRIIEVIKPQLLMLDDGYWAYWVDGKGAWKAEDLRVIADHLDALNKDWDAKIRDYFEAHR